MVCVTTFSHETNMVGGMVASSNTISMEPYSCPQPGWVVTISLTKIRLFSASEISIVPEARLQTLVLVVEPETGFPMMVKL